MHHDEECLLEWILDGCGGRKHLVEALLDELGYFERIKGGLLDADRDSAQAPWCARIGQKVLRENAVEIEDCVAVESDLVGGVDEEFNGLFVVDDHLRLEVIAPLRFFAELDEAFGVEEGIGVAFEAA